MQIMMLLFGDEAHPRVNKKDLGKLYLEGSWSPDVCLHYLSTALLYHLPLLRVLCEYALWRLANPFNYPTHCNLCKNNEYNIAVFVFQCCITSYWKLSSLNQHSFIISQFYRSEIRAWCGCVFCLGSQQAKIMVLTSLHHHLELGVLFRAYVDVARFSSLGFLFPCLLSAISLLRSLSDHRS